MLKIHLSEKYIPENKKEMFEYAKELVNSKKMSVEEAIVISFRKYGFFQLIDICYRALIQNQDVGKLAKYPPKNKKVYTMFREFYGKALKDVSNTGIISSSTKRILDECVEMV